jgi:phosphatidate cytidylyltransferase
MSVSFLLAVYLVILLYFILGAVGFHFINRRKSPEQAAQNRLKLFTYFLIITTLYLAIVTHTWLFMTLAIIIAVAGMVELMRLFSVSRQSHWVFFSISLLLYLVLASGFMVFSMLEKQLVLFTFLVLSIFDSFCQISGQLFGRRKLFPAISPNKTVEGLAGGTLVALLSAVWLRAVPGIGTGGAVMLALGIILFAWVGDMASSYYKRRFGVKDFSNTIPGHGGFLDRFDSLLAGGFFTALFYPFI